MMLGLIPGMSLAAYAEGQQHTHNGITCEEWTDALAQAQNGNGKTAANSLPSVAGAYYLTKNVELDDLWSVPADTTYLCLNGHTITRNNDSYVIQIASGRTLNLANCAFLSCSGTEYYIRDG